MLEEELILQWNSIAYFIGLIPFRLRYRQRRNSWDRHHTPLPLSSQISVNKIQKILCGILLTFALLQGILITRGSYTAKVIQSPRVMFKIWSSITEGPILISVLIYTFFNKKEQLLSALNILCPNGIRDVPSKRIRFLISTILMTLGVLFPISVDLLTFLDHSSGGFRQLAVQPLYDLFLISDPKLGVGVGTFTQGVRVISVLYLVLRAYGRILFTMAQLLVLSYAITGSRLVRKLYAKVIDPEDDSCFIILYRELQVIFQLIKCLNSFGGSILLCLLSSSVPFFVLQLVSAWDSHQISLKFNVLVQFFIYIITFIFASDLQYKGELLKSRLLERSHLERHLEYSGRISRQEFGLAVGYFGFISFGVIGSIFSAYLSYSIMLLQIRIPQFTCK